PAGHPLHEPILLALAEIFRNHNENGFVTIAYETVVWYGPLTHTLSRSRVRGARVRAPSCCARVRATSCCARVRATSCQPGNSFTMDMNDRSIAAVAPHTNSPST